MSDLVSEPQLRSVLSHYGEPFLAASIESLGSSAGFSGARVWRVESDGRRFALRGTDAASVDCDRLRGLHRLLACVTSRGLSILPVPQRTAVGGTFVVQEDLVWQLEPWMPGAADFHASRRSERLVAAMRGLAAFHRAAETFEPLEPERPWFFHGLRPSPGLHERLRHIVYWNDGQRRRVRAELAHSDWREFRDLALLVLRLFEQHAPRIAGMLHAARDVEVRVQPCLRDVWHDHLLFTGDELTGLIDPHASRSDCVATDLARLLGSLLGDDRPSWDFALQVYQEVQPLSVDERCLVELFDQSAVLLNGLTWLDWICLRKRRFASPDRVSERLRGIVERMQRL